MSSIYFECSIEITQRPHQYKDQIANSQRSSEVLCLLKGDIHHSIRRTLKPRNDTSVKAISIPRILLWLRRLQSGNICHFLNRYLKQKMRHIHRNLKSFLKVKKVSNCFHSDILTTDGRTSTMHRKIIIFLFSD